MTVISTIFEICFIAATIISFLALVGYLILLKLGKAPELTDDKLDKIIDLLECLASEHLDEEAMKEIQNASVVESEDQP